jgi:hypothetical protein
MHTSRCPAQLPPKKTRCILLADAVEVLCPLCRRVCNTLLPVVSLPLSPKYRLHVPSPRPPGAAFQLALARREAVEGLSAFASHATQKLAEYGEGQAAAAAFVRALAALQGRAQAPWGGGLTPMRYREAQVRGGGEGA